MDAVWVTACLSVREGVRRRLVLAAAILGLLYLLVYGTGLYFMNRDIVASPQGNRDMLTVQAFNMFGQMGMYGVQMLYAVIVVLSSAATLAGEISSGTLQSVAAKPVRRWQIVIGKWLGFVMLLSPYELAMTAGVVGLLRVITGYPLPHPLRAIGLIWASGMVLLSVSLLGGTRLSTIANGVVVFALYAMAFVGGWVEGIGSYLQSQAAVNVGIVSSLILPTEALWKRAAHEMESSLMGLTGFSPFSSGSTLPNTTMLVYAGVYAVVALGLAVWSFSRRDL